MQVPDKDTLKERIIIENVIDLDSNHNLILINIFQVIIRSPIKGIKTKPTLFFEDVDIPLV